LINDLSLISEKKQIINIGIALPEDFWQLLFVEK